MKTIPFDYAAIERDPDWREGFAWPLSYAETRPIMRDFFCRLLKATLALDDPHLRNVGILTTQMFSDSLFVLETALLAQAGQGKGLQFTGGPEDVGRLQGQAQPGQGQAVSGRAALPPQKITHRFLRRVARCASWTAWHRLPATVLMPEIVAIAHNGTLRAHALSSDARIGFCHADAYLEDARRLADQDQGETDLSPLHALIAAVVEDTDALSAQMKQLATDCILAHVKVALVGADRDLRGLSLLKKLPAHVWAGSAGYRPVRAVCLEVRRRGGSVTLHDHSGGAGTIMEMEALALVELCIASRFVVPTASMHRNLMSTDVLSLLDSGTRPEIIVGQGDNTFQKLVLSDRPLAEERPNVLYVCGAMDGILRRSPPDLADPVKLDWWMRMSEMMKAMPVNLKVQPHPGGLLRGKPHPVGQVAELTGTIFENVAEWADVFVFDVTQATPLIKALCTDRPIVIVDFGRTTFSPAVEEMMRQRCSFVTAGYDEHNRPVVDPAALEQAILSARRTTQATDFADMYGGIRRRA